MRPARPPRALGWWSPDPRGVLPLDGLRVTRSLRRSCRRFTVTVDTDFADVLAGVRRPAPAGRVDHRRHPGGVHRAAPARASRTRSRPGTGTASWSAACTASAIGGLFAGESMFHSSRTRRVEGRAGRRWSSCSPATASPDGCSTCSGARRTWRRSGAVEIPREQYLERLASALQLPPAAPQPPPGRSRSRRRGTPVTAPGDRTPCVRSAAPTSCAAHPAPGGDVGGRGRVVGQQPDDRAGRHLGGASRRASSITGSGQRRPTRVDDEQPPVPSSQPTRPERRARPGATASGSTSQEPPDVRLGARRGAARPAGCRG